MENAEESDEPNEEEIEPTDRSTVTNGEETIIQH